MIFYQYWLADLHSKFSFDYEICILNDSPHIPNFAPRDLDLGETSAVLCDTDGDRIIEMRLKKELIVNFDERIVFSKVGEFVDGAIPEYVSFAQSECDRKLTYLTSDTKIAFTHSGFGSLEISPSKDSLLIGVPIHNRYTLTDLFCRYVTSYLIPGLVWAGYEVSLILCGDSDDLNPLRKYASPRVVGFEHQNNLGKKKNAMMEVALAAEVDYLMWLDSDDFLHPNLCDSLIDLASFNGYWSSVEPCLFFDSQNKEYRLFEGYAPNHQLGGWGLGSGRVFTRKLLQMEKLAYVESNKSMDDSVKKALSELDIDTDCRLIREPEYLPIGVKTDQNIWKVGGYKTELAQNPNWLPRDIRERINNISHDAC